MYKRINLQQAQELVKKVQTQIVTSNNIASRIEFPYFHTKNNIPKSLEIYKDLLARYRMLSHALMEEFYKSQEKSQKNEFNDFSIGAFAHLFVGSLSITYFGIGECAECAALLAVQLVQGGYNNFALIGTTLNESKEGMEQGHNLIITNLPKVFPNVGHAISIYDFFKKLPKDAVIIDTFLELCFTSDNIPNKFRKYINVYGGKASVDSCFHFFNLVAEKFLGYYLPIANNIAQQMEQILFQAFPYTLTGKTRITDNSLIELLKTKTGLPFFGVRDEEYKVDVVISLIDKACRLAVFKLQDKLNGYGCFFHAADKKNVFVLEGVNISHSNGSKANVGQEIRNSLLR